MSLLVTSCTMGKQPDRLLNKGPDYLRTRTNHGIFSSENRKSAVELLAASKSQFYTLKDSRTILDSGQDLAVTSGQHNKYGDKKRHRSKSKNLPLSSRSKSEHNLAQLQLSPKDEDKDFPCETTNDLNNNSNKSKASDDHTGETVELVEATRRLSLENSSSTSKGYGSSVTNPICQSNTRSRKKFSDLTRDTQISSDEQAETVLPLPPTAAEKVTPKAAVKEDTNAAPWPCPRKRKEKPVPPPRRRSPRISSNQTGEGKLQLTPSSQNTTISTPNQPVHVAALNSKSSITAKTEPKDQSSNPNHANAVFKSTAHLSLSAPANTRDTVTAVKPKVPPRPRKLDYKAASQGPELATPVDTAESPSPGEATSKVRKPSLVETLTKQFTSLSASKPSRTTSCETSSSDNPHLFKATPVFIGKCENSPSNDVFIPSPEADPSTLKESNRISSLSGNNVSRTSRKRYPEFEHSADSYSKREKRSVHSSNKTRKPKLPPGIKPRDEFNLRGKSVTHGLYSPQSTGKSEMSIESAEQAITESEINAIPLATMESDNPQSCGGDEMVEGQEITRRNSSRSGRLDPGDASQSSGGSGQRHSSGGYSSSVPRSHSDISFRLGSSSGVAGDGLGGQHSRDSSIVSSHSRLSRASVGADLENFFNQMGLEMGVLEPIARLRELQRSGSAGGENALGGGDTSTFGSMSSLDSQDAASICSTYSRSEHECAAGTGGLSLGASGGAEVPPLTAAGHQQPQSSVVERNARIIKWLCNVRKAIKGGQSKSEARSSSSAASASATGKA